MILSPLILMINPTMNLIGGLTNHMRGWSTLLLYFENTKDFLAISDIDTKNYLLFSDRCNQKLIM